MEIHDPIESPVMARKKSKTSPSTENTDWISKLPDALLSHILSFIPTKNSVRTRLLSKRWKHLFTIVPILDFFNPTTPDPEITRSFLDFVGWVFNSYNVDRMDKFCYSARGSIPETSRLLSWISEAVRRGVRELQVLEAFHEDLLLPRGIYTCKTLTVLEIRGRFIVEVPDDVCLPHVKTLHLSGVSFVDGSSAGRLFRSCHVLEELSLSCCTGGEDGEVFNISVPTLKNLNIQGYDDKFKLELGVPKLEIFEYDGHSGYFAHGFVAVQELKSLVKACVGFLTYEYNGYKALDKLICMVCHVQNLSISSYTLEAFQRSHLPLQTFRNLTHVEISVISRFDAGSVLHFLQKTPLLEVLVVDNGWGPREEFVDNINQRGGPLLSENVPACVCLRLREIEFKGFLMLEYECQLVEYFLKNAKILDTLRVMCKGSLENQFEMSKKLLTFSRCSKACHIILDSAMRKY